MESVIARAPLAALMIVGLCGGCSQSSPMQADAPSPRDPVSSSPASSAPPAIVRWVRVAELPRDIAIMDSVFWEPDDTVSLRQRIATTPEMKHARVLEVGTGSGLVALCCLAHGASAVVATDLNPAAVTNAQFNAIEFGFKDQLDVRLVPRRDPDAWTVIRPEERFDFIISNPPWENEKPSSVEQFALYDPEFALLTSLVSGANDRLTPGGRMWLAYGCVTAIREIQSQAATAQLSCTLLDDRPLESLPELFLPGMLIELRVPD